MNTFLVTGCNGYIGSHMAAQLRDTYKNCKIVGVDKVEKEHIKHLFDKLYIFDLTDEKKVDMIFKENMFDCVFHFAAYASVPEGELYPEKYYNNNCNSTLNLSKYCMINNVKNFVFSSTCAVYGDQDFTDSLDENSGLNPISVYAKTKLNCEKKLQQVKSYNLAILRYFNAAGRSVKHNLYEEHDPETHLIPVLRQSNEVEIYGGWNTDDGTPIRDYIHVMDICSAHISAYEYLNTNNTNIICNIGTGIGYSVFEIVKLARMIWNKTIKTNIKGRRDGDVKKLIANVNKMNTELKFKTKYDIVDILESMK